MTPIEEEQDAGRDVQDDMYRHREKVGEHDCPHCCGCGCCGGDH